MDQTFSTGLLFGPSGCGKSSLVKAGLIPRLAEHVNSVYVESTKDNTEAWLLNRLRKRCRDLPPSFNLAQSLAAIRQNRILPAGHKVVLILLDQFGSSPELVGAEWEMDFLRHGRAQKNSVELKKSSLLPKRLGWRLFFCHPRQAIPCRVASPQSPSWAEKFLDQWCTPTMPSKIEPMKKVAQTLRNHRELILSGFEQKVRFRPGRLKALTTK